VDGAERIGIPAQGMALEPGFVNTDKTLLVLNGSPFPVVGVNCYFLGWCGDTAREVTLQAIMATGVNVIRSMAFLNSVERPASGPTFQYSSNGSIVVNEGPDGLGRLDSLVHSAEQYGYRLILPLVNYWDDLGGMRTYLEWLFPGQNLATEEFYRRPEARAAFKNWAASILNRHNSITGKVYRDSPAILAWELANEPRCPIPGGRELLLDWTRDISQFLKTQDPNHLVALGDEGFLRHNDPPNHLYTGEYGVDFEATLGIPEIDFGSYHFYPAPKQMNVPLGFARRWIDDHVAAGQRANKPAILEEYGIRIGDYGVTLGSERDGWYARWQQAVYDSGGAGDLLWMIGSREPEVAGNHDDYTVYSASEIPSIVVHADAMRNRGKAAGI
jgi:mannan endo-1,4-beta-mannosidase